MERIILDDTKTYSLAGTDQEVQFIVDVLNLPAGSAILDLFCGYGRHAIELAKLGFQLTGIDTTDSLLDIARQKAKEAHIDVQFEQRDMREMSYENNFDAIISMFAAFGFFSDNENEHIIAKIGAALKPGGLFLLDLLNRDWMLNNNLTRYWRHPSGDYVLSYKVELTNGITVMKREVLNQTTGAKTRYEYPLRAYSLQELSTVLARQGLQVVKVFGNFDCRPYDSEQPRMIIKAQKIKL